MHKVLEVDALDPNRLVGLEPLDCLLDGPDDSPGSEDDRVVQGRVGADSVGSRKPLRHFPGVASDDAAGH